MTLKVAKNLQVGVRATWHSMFLACCQYCQAGCVARIASKVHDCRRSEI